MEIKKHIGIVESMFSYRSEVKSAAEIVPNAVDMDYSRLNAGITKIVILAKGSKIVNEELKRRIPAGETIVARLKKGLIGLIM